MLANRVHRVCGRSVCVALGSFCETGFSQECGFPGLDATFREDDFSGLGTTNLNKCHNQKRRHNEQTEPDSGYRRHHNLNKDCNGHGNYEASRPCSPKTLSEAVSVACCTIAFVRSCATRQQLSKIIEAIPQ